MNFPFTGLTVSTCVNGRRPSTGILAVAGLPPVMEKAMGAKAQHREWFAGGMGEIGPRLKRMERLVDLTRAVLLTFDTDGIQCGRAAPAASLRKDSPTNVLPQQ